MTFFIPALTVLAAFAAAHERLIEVIRGLNERYFGFAWLERATRDFQNVLFACAFALLTQADLLALFRPGNERDTVLFFERYLSFTLPANAGDTSRMIMGCILMGFA